jgi:hypothetical protein
MAATASSRIINKIAPIAAKIETEKIIVPPEIKPRIRCPAVILITNRRVRVIGRRNRLISSVNDMAMPNRRFPRPAGVMWALQI